MLKYTVELNGWIQERHEEVLCDFQEIKGEKNYISYLTHDGVEVSDQPNILQVVHDYYSNLYQEKAISNEACEHMVSAIDRQLSASDRDNCDCPLQIEELTAALKEMKTNKSPGLDGMTTEFYWTFWSLLSQDFFDVVTEMYESRRMSSSMRTGIIRLIPKQGRHQQVDQLATVQSSQR